MADGAVVTVGTFDGVHLGHRDILQRTLDRASARGLPSVVVTFRPHPLAVVNPPAAPLLLTPGEEQLEAIADSGMQYVIALPFTKALASYSAEQFVRSVMIERYCTRELIIGYDHGLGRGRQADAGALVDMGRALGFPVHVVPPTHDQNGAPVSSSTIRSLLAHGDLDHAGKLLGRRYAIRGRVVRGAGRGRGLGFPTLNIVPASDRKLLPPDGVYAVRASSRYGEFDGMMNLGGRPTFGDLERALEVHLFGMSGDWHQESVRVELVKRLRDVIRFPNKDALVDQLGRDREAARRALTQA